MKPKERLKILKNHLFSNVILDQNTFESNAEICNLVCDYSHKWIFVEGLFISEWDDYVKGEYDWE